MLNNRRTILDPRVYWLIFVGLPDMGYPPLSVLFHQE